MKILAKSTCNRSAGGRRHRSKCATVRKRYRPDSGPMAGGGSASSTTQGMGGTQRIETTGQATTTKKEACQGSAQEASVPRGQEAPLSRQEQGPGAPAPRGAEFLLSNWQNHERGRRRALVGWQGPTFGLAPLAPASATT